MQQLTSVLCAITFNGIRKSSVLSTPAFKVNNYNSVTAVSIGKRTIQLEGLLWSKKLIDLVEEG